MARNASTGASALEEERLLEAANEAVSTSESRNSPVDSSYCLAEGPDLVVARLKPAVEQLLYRVCDTSGHLVFYATCDDSNFESSEAVLHDSTGRAIAVLKGERFSTSRGSRSRWIAYREVSEQVRDESDSNLLFTVIQERSRFNSSFDIILPNREGDSSQPPQFTARTGFFGRGFAVVLGDAGSCRHPLRIAKAKKMTKHFGFPCCNFNSEHRSRIQISAGVDRAFVASLFVLVDLARRRRCSASSPIIAVPAESPVALGIPASTLHNGGNRSNKQWVSPTEDALQEYAAYAFYHQMYASGHECNETASKSNQLPTAVDEQRQAMKSKWGSPAEDAFQAYNFYHQMHISSHGARL